MIRDFEGYTEELSEEEMKLVPAFVAGLKSKIGKKNAITNRQIQKAFQAHERWKIDIPDARVRKIINHIRVNGLVMGLCASSKGYYVASSNQELEDYLEGLKQRIRSQLAVYDSIEYQKNLMRNSF